jgi:hypothetical protein
LALLPIRGGWDSSAVALSATARAISARAVRAADFCITSFVNRGCAIHPIQQDVTGLRTLDIVNHIRCETRLAIQDKAIQLLRRYKDGNDERSIRFAKQLSDRRGEWWQIDPKRELWETDQREFYFRYIGTGIAYDLPRVVSSPVRGQARRVFCFRPHAKHNSFSSFRVWKSALLRPCQ